MASHTFLWKGDGAHVTLLGSFDRWKLPGRTMDRVKNGFAITISLLPGRYEYKFIVDGECRCDPHKEVVHDGQGKFSNIYEIPSENTTNVRTASLNHQQSRDSLTQEQPTYYTVKITCIAKTVTEETLTKLVEKHGTLVSRVAIQGTKNRYAWVNFDSLEGAKRSVENLNGYCLEDSKLNASLKQSSNVSAIKPLPCPAPTSKVNPIKYNPENTEFAPNHKLFTIKITCLPSSLTRESLAALLRDFGELPKLPKIFETNNRYALANFTTMEDAMKAIRGLDNTLRDGHTIKASLKEGQTSKPNVPSQSQPLLAAVLATMATPPIVTTPTPQWTVRVDNLDPLISQAELKAMVSVPVLKMEQVSPSQTVLYFSSSANADKAVQELNGVTLLGKTVQARIQLPSPQGLTRVLSQPPPMSYQHSIHMKTTGARHPSSNNNEGTPQPSPLSPGLVPTNKLYTIKITCLPPSLTRERLAALLRAFGELPKLPKIFDSKNQYALANFTTMEDAVKAIQGLDKTVLDGYTIKASLKEGQTTKPDVPSQSQPLLAVIPATMATPPIVTTPTPQWTVRVDNLDPMISLTELKAMVSVPVLKMEKVSPLQTVLYFSSSTDADKAVQELNGVTLLGKTVQARIQLPSPQRLRRALSEPPSMTAQPMYSVPTDVSPLLHSRMSMPSTGWTMPPPSPIASDNQEGAYGTSPAAKHGESDENAEPESRLTIGTLMSKTNVTAQQLNQSIGDKDLYPLAGLFEHVEIYIDNFKLNASQKADVKCQANSHETQLAMKLALKYWRKANPYAATYRALIEILLDLKSGEIAVEVCKYCQANSAVCSRK